MKDQEEELSSREDFLGKYLYLFVCYGKVNFEYVCVYVFDIDYVNDKIYSIIFKS